MILFAVIFGAMAGAQVASLAEQVERISATTAAERVAKCGLGPTLIRYEEELQSEVLATTTVTAATDEQLGCAVSAASYYELELAPALQARYEAIRTQRWAVRARVEAQSWLTAHGLLGQVPRYDSRTSDDAAFTRQIEKLCGPRAKGAFQSTFGFHVISPAWLKREFAAPAFASETFTCLMNAATVAKFDVGLIGK